MRGDAGPGKHLIQQTTGLTSEMPSGHIDVVPVMKPCAAEPPTREPITALV